MHILIIEDDLEQAAELASRLESEGHSIDHAEDGEVALRKARAHEYDVLIVDRMIPKMDGLSVLATLRNEANQVPALILSALGQVDDRVHGLRAGGDDYLSKPYSFSELLARVEVLARRSEASAQTKVTCGDLEVDRMARAVSRAGKRITLQPREYRLLDYLLRNEGKVVTRTMLLEHVWDLHFDPQTNVIDVHISRLRSKIDKGFDQPLLHTIRGRGYRLAPLEHDAGSAATAT